MVNVLPLPRKEIIDNITDGHQKHKMHIVQPEHTDKAFNSERRNNLLLSKSSNSDNKNK